MKYLFCFYYRKLFSIQLDNLVSIVISSNNLGGVVFTFSVHHFSPEMGAPLLFHPSERRSIVFYSPSRHKLTSALKLISSGFHQFTGGSPAEGYAHSARIDQFLAGILLSLDVHCHVPLSTPTSLEAHAS
jgi:hypothetical protein